MRAAGHKVGKLLSIRDAIFPAGDHVAGGGGGKGTGPTLLLLRCQAQSRGQVSTCSKQLWKLLMSRHR